MTERAGRRYEVGGVVQGVGYRAFARRTALELGLSGSAENRPDGSVLVLAFGTPSALLAFENELRRGPRHGRVDRLVASEIPVEASDGNQFRIR